MAANNNNDNNITTTNNIQFLSCREVVTSKTATITDYGSNIKSPHLSEKLITKDTIIRIINLDN